MSELTVSNKFSDMFGGGKLFFEINEGGAIITSENSVGVYYAEDYENQIEAVLNSHDSMVEQLAKQQTEIAEYKAFMLGLKLSSEDEARLLDLLAKHKKGE